MTPSGVYKTRNVRRRPELERWDFEFLTDAEGYAVEPEPGGGRDGSRCTSRGYGSPDASTCTRPSSRGGSGTGGQSSEQVVHHEVRCAEIWLQHELSGTTARAHTEECRRKLENCLAEEEETKFRSEAAKLRVDSWLTS